MKINLEIIEPELIKTFSYNPNEPYELSIAGKTYYKETKRELLPSFIGETKGYVESWANERNMSVNYIEVVSGDALYSSNYQTGTIVSQKEHAGQLVETLKDLTVYVIKRNETTNDQPISVVEEPEENYEHENVTEEPIEEPLEEILSIENP